MRHRLHAGDAAAAAAVQVLSTLYFSIIWDKVITHFKISLKQVQHFLLDM